MLSKNDRCADKGMIEEIDRANPTMLIMFLHCSLACFERSRDRFILVNIVIAVKEIHANLREQQRADQKCRGCDRKNSQFHGL